MRLSSRPFPTPEGPQRTMSRGGGRSGGARSRRTHVATTSDDAYTSAMRSKSAPPVFATPMLSFTQPVSQENAGMSAGLCSSIRLNAFISLRMALLTRSGHCITGRVPAMSARPKRSTGTRSSTVTHRHWSITKSRTQYLPVGLTVGKPSLPFGLMSSHRKSPCFTCWWCARTFCIVASNHSIASLPTKRAPSPASTRPLPAFLASPSSGGARSTSGMSGLSCSSSSGRFHPSRNGFMLVGKDISSSSYLPS
mmetsp:Transcript_11486/g.37767  ORF Transcript_11486/g.37767 Transcript_11486/m.37767 type:complete len:252 (-) Transcript_11486:126-881(-)